MAWSFCLPVSFTSMSPRRCCFRATIGHAARISLRLQFRPGFLVYQVLTQDKMRLREE